MSRYVQGEWYAGCQYDGDIAAAKKVLENLDKYYPGAKEIRSRRILLVAGRQGHAQRRALRAMYEKNLIQLIQTLRKDFDAPEAKFVTASLGQTKEGSKGGDGQDPRCHGGRVAKNSDPDLKGIWWAFVYTNPLSNGRKLQRPLQRQPGNLHERRRGNGQGDGRAVV